MSDVMNFVTDSDDKTCIYSVKYASSRRIYCLSSY